MKTKIGEGYSSIVYKLDNGHVLKCIKITKNNIRFVMGELRTLALIKDKDWRGFPKIYHIQKNNKYLEIEMEYFNTGFLDWYNEKRTAHEWSDCLKQISEALNQLRSVGRCHGDLHYENIMLRDNDFVLIDFGHSENYSDACHQRDRQVFWDTFDNGLNIRTRDKVNLLIAQGFNKKNAWKIVDNWQFNKYFDGNLRKDIMKYPDQIIKIKNH